MAEKAYPDRVVDPADLLNLAFERVWEVMRCTYDVYAGMPDWETLLNGADLSCPGRTAQGVIVNMLHEVMEGVSRYSPWYRKPARAYGLIRTTDTQSGRAVWALAPEAVQRWQEYLDPLAVTIRKNNGLIQAVLLVNGLLAGADSADAEIAVSCHCLPPRTIQVRRSVLDQADIVCDACLFAFT